MTLYNSRPIEERFWEKVNKRSVSECWNWTACKLQTGYGRIGKGKEHVYAHRLSWILHNGPIPKGMHVLHKCDNPACVNPDHLWLGTHADNMKDRDEKERRTPPKGDETENSKLTEEQVIEIRSKYQFRKYTSKMLAKEYGVCPSNILSIIHRHTWKHI